MAPIATTAPRWRSRRCVMELTSSLQAGLQDGQWNGYADVLRKVPGVSSALGDWSYEAQDTKLSRETRGGTILQLSVYSELLGRLQQRPPERFRVVTPFQSIGYRVDDFGAFYRRLKSHFLDFTSAREIPKTYPDPTEHCPVCRWSSRCNARRRADDHLSLVCGLGRNHRAELTGRSVDTMTALAGLPVPLTFAPKRGAKETYERLREQARLQVGSSASAVSRNSSCSK